MAIEQSFILTSNIGATLDTFEKAVVGLSGSATATFDSLLDSELTVTNLGNDQFSISINTLLGDENTQALLTLFLTLSNGESCIKTIPFEPTTFDCPPSALQGSEQYATFTVSGVDEDGKVTVNNEEDCLVFIKTTV